MAEIELAQRVVVSDAGPIIHLSELDCLDVLSDFNEVLIPPIVWEEILRHQPKAFATTGVAFRQSSIGVEAPEAMESLTRLFTLHRGELQALQLALEQHADLILTDDTAARLAANSLGIPIHGTLGLLLRSFRRNQKSRIEVVRLLQLIPTRSSLHIKRSLLDELIHMTESEPEHYRPNKGDSIQ